MVYPGSREVAYTRVYRVGGVAYTRVYTYQHTQGGIYGKRASQPPKEERIREDESLPASLKGEEKEEREPPSLPKRRGKELKGGPGP